MARDVAYARLAEKLVADIAAGHYEVGGRLPTEAVLCAQTGLSRGTVREALAQVERLGMISRRPRDGSRVIAVRPVEDYQPVIGSSDDIMALVRRTRIVRPTVSEVRADRALASRLGARTGSHWRLIAGVRERRDQPGTPLCWSEQYVRPDDAAVDVVLRGEFTAAEAAAAETEQIVTAELLDTELAQRLGTTSLVALVVTRRHHDRGGRLVSVGIHTHPGDSFAIRSRIAPRED